MIDRLQELTEEIQRLTEDRDHYKDLYERSRRVLASGQGSSVPQQP